MNSLSQGIGACSDHRGDEINEDTVMDEEGELIRFKLAI